MNMEVKNYPENLSQTDEVNICKFVEEEIKIMTEVYHSLLDTRCLNICMCVVCKILSLFYIALRYIFFTKSKRVKTCLKGKKYDGI